MHKVLPSLDRRPSASFFRNKVALVTGAASGIGRALVTELTAAGAIVEASDVDPAVATIGARGSHVLDVTDGPKVRRWIEDAAARHGSLDLLFNNAGICIGGEAQNLSPDDWQRSFDILLNGVVYGVQAAYPIMLRQRSGHIVNTSSIAGLTPAPLAIPYTAAKHAVVGLSTALRAEAAAHGVHVTVVCPGAIQTEIWNRSELRGIDRALALGRIPYFTTATSCARQVLRGIEKNRGIIVVNPEAKLVWALNRISPPLANYVARRIVKSLRETRVVASPSHVVP